VAGPTLAGLVTCGGPDSLFTVEDFTQQGDKIWVRVRARGTASERDLFGRGVRSRREPAAAVASSSSGRKTWPRTARTAAVNLGQDLSILFIVILLLMVFRSLLAPLLTLAPAVLVTQLAGPVIGEASKAGLQVSSLTQILLLILTLGAGTDYGLFLVFRVREELRTGRVPHDAVTHALARVGESITFSAATVIAALLTLLLATFGLYSSLGAPLAIAITLMLLAALTLLPALLAIFGRAAF
jgi:predicted exporter